LYDAGKMPPGTPRVMHRSQAVWYSHESVILARLASLFSSAHAITGTRPLGGSMTSDRSLVSFRPVASTGKLDGPVPPPVPSGSPA
jgi:hypothetical protein